MKRIIIIAISTLLIPVIAAGTDASKQASVDMQVLKISSQDQRAVIKTADGKMKVVKVGDQIAELRVVEIAKDRVVLEENKGKETAKIIIRLENEKQRVERIEKVQEKTPQLLAPKSAPSVSSGGANLFNNNTTPSQKSSGK